MKKGRTEVGQFSGKSDIEEALRRLNAKMVYAEMDPIELISCGGASLNLLGLVSRSTTDVDIICAAKVDMADRVHFVPAVMLPPEFDELVAEVGRELGLKEQWLNFGPAPLVDFGLPRGLAGRLKRRSYGRCLALHM
jgi:hypothetical protein